MLVRGPGERAAPSPITSLGNARVTPPASPVAAADTSPFAQLVNKLGAELARGERTVAVALAPRGGGADLGPAELLALQAGIYRYSEAVDLAAKLVDRVSSGVKTVIQGQ
jgi:hypothetical protein